ncbi:tRNA lysidine(34) synthetase TilS [Desulfosarcina ovata]|nr:tRNA lysidine(34) synthetase TilS [Desulfosarcina ovata]
MPPSSATSDSHPLMATVRQTLARHQMINAGDRILVGVSGGPDSMALLHLLHHLAPSLDIHLGVAHLNHCLRGLAADADAALVRRASSALNHPCHEGRAHVSRVKQGLHLSPEEAARRVRYAFFNKTMRDGGYNKLALGHHLDDNAEQMLLALLRGSGPRGLSGIAPVRDRRIIRPLINVRRKMIEDYIATSEIACASDESNTDLRFLRNRIRHRLLPLLADEYNSRIHHHLSRLANIMRCEEAWTEALTDAPYAAAVVKRDNNHLVLCVKRLHRAHPALARRLVRRALEVLCGTLRRITFAHVIAVLRLLAESADGKEVHLPGGVRVRRNGDRLDLQRCSVHRRWRTDGPATIPQGLPMRIDAPFPETIQMTSLGFGLRFSTCRADALPDWKTVGPHQAFFDLKRISAPLTLRPVRPGDRFTPLGASGSQKLKKFFIDHHVPQNDRAIAPVLTDSNRIIWLVGRRMDDFVKVTHATTCVLVVEFFLIDTR